MCLGLVAPDAGSISLLGHPVPRDARAARVRVGVVPQQDNIDPDFTVEETWWSTRATLASVARGKKTHSLPARIRQSRIQARCALQTSPAA